MVCFRRLLLATIKCFSEQNWQLEITENRPGHTVPAASIPSSTVHPIEHTASGRFPK